MYIEKKSSRRIRIEQNIVETQWHGATTALRRRSYTCCHNSKRALRYGIPTPRIHISPASSYMAAQVLILHIYWHSTTPLHLHQAGRQAGRQELNRYVCHLFLFAFLAEFGAFTSHLFGLCCFSFRHILPFLLLFVYIGILLMTPGNNFSFLCLVFPDV